MCTAISYRSNRFYFGRTLDHDESYQEEVVVIPRHFPLPHLNTPADHYAVIGMAHIANGYPLLYDGINEKGLAMAGLNFVGFSHYPSPVNDVRNIPAYALISCVLGECSSVLDAKSMLTSIRITNENYSDDLPCPHLHWIIADKTESITVESCVDGLHIHSNPLGVLTNNPPFDQQLTHLSNFMMLTEKPPVNRFPGAPDLAVYSNGMGAFGLPGDFSSQSRFVRAAFFCGSSIRETEDVNCVTQFFHILDGVAQINGCCQLPNENFEKTIYSSCCNCDKGIYYYTSYSNRQVTAVNMHRCDLDSNQLFRYPLLLEQQIKCQN